MRRCARRRARARAATRLHRLHLIHRLRPLHTLHSFHSLQVLKTEGENQWVNNIQVTVWIMFWIGCANYVRPVLGGLASLLSGGGGPVMSSPTELVAAAKALPATVVSAFDGFTPAVWGVVLLKGLNGILIPATFKYADNILYSYAKPSSIVVTTLFGAAVAGVLPPLTLLAGVLLVVVSMQLYSSK